MARRFVKRFLPDRSRIEGEMPRWIGKVLLSPQLWHLNRHSVSRGLAIGSFWAWMPVPQSIPAAFMAIYLRGNVLLAIATTWLSNPFTLVPWILVCYKIGRFVTGARPMGNPVTELKAIFSGSESFGHFWSYVANNLHVLWVFTVGCVVFGTLFSAATYFLVNGLWRWNLSRRWAKRGHPHRCTTCRRRVHLPPWSPSVSEHDLVCPGCGERLGRYRRLGHGIASIARRAARVR